MSFLQQDQISPSVTHCQYPQHRLSAGPDQAPDAVLFEKLKRPVYVIAVCSAISALLSIAAISYAASVGARTSAAVKTYYLSVASPDQPTAQLTPDGINSAAKNAFAVLANAVPISEHVNELTGVYSDDQISNATSYVSQSLSGIAPGLWGEMARNSTALVNNLQNVDYSVFGDLAGRINRTDVERQVGLRVDNITAEIHKYRDLLTTVLMIVKIAGKDLEL